MTKDELSRCIALMEGYWPHGVRTWTPEAVEIWEGLLLDLDARLVATAIQTLATRGREFPPPPGLLRRQALELVSDLPNAEQAWGEVCEQIHRVGVYRGWSGSRELEWSHPLVGRLADSLGWEELCMSENQMADRAHFLKLWAAAVENEHAVENMPPAGKALLASVLADKGLHLPNLNAQRALEQTA